MSVETFDSFPVPMDNPELYYRATIGGVLTPGAIAKGGITGWGLETDIEVKKGKGANDATLTDTGDKPPTGTIKIQLWRRGEGDDPNDFDDWQAFFLMLRAARKAKKALDIVHPIINLQEVRSVLVKNIGALTDAGAGLWTVELELIKWVPDPPSAGGTPAGSQDKDGNGPDDKASADKDPNAALKQEFADKAAEAEEN